MFKGFLKSKIDTDPAKIESLLTRGVEEIFVKENLLQKLASGRELRVKLGFDPTGSDIHIGRAILLRKLKEFQNLGHKVIFIVGDFTAQVGDPSDKLEKRPMISGQKIKENIAKYKEQVSKIIDVSKADFLFNSSWLGKLGFQEISELAESFSIQQMSNRRNFKERLSRGEEVSLREFLYPLMQGYDSVEVRSDVEIGGFDQLFNLKAGRIIQKHYGQKEQDVLTTEMLPGTDGRKMSTSWGNVVNIVDEPSSMFGKIMSLDDSLIEKYFLLCTEVSLEDIESIKKKLAEGANPRDLKLRLASEIVALYHDGAAAKSAQENFVKTFSGKQAPEEMPVARAAKGDSLVDVLLGAGAFSSKTQIRRLITEGAVTNLATNQKITDPAALLEENMKLRLGKHQFIEIEVS